MNKLKSFLLMLILLVFVVISINFVSADCWQHTTESACNADTAGCNWYSDPYSVNGGWCEQLNCWSLYNQTDCETRVVPGKNCTWQPGGTSYSCEKVGCYSYDATNASYCVNNSAGLGCSWHEECHGWAAGIDCWSITNEASCRNITGCEWGSCWTKSCYDYTTETTCRAAKDWNGNNCTWETDYCTENGCWKYHNKTACNAVTDLDDKADQDCIWRWDYCQDVGCWVWDGTNSTACLNNSANLSCTWDGQWCMEKSCWNFGTESDCLSESGCVWSSYTSGGWCEEVNCWTWDGWNGGTELACLNNASIYSLSCVWEYGWDGTNQSGWCYQDISTLNCSNFTTERDCMDTYWCWWEYKDWSNPSLGGYCKDPQWGGAGFSGEGIFDVWNPGCYIFDTNSTNCNNTIGCNYSFATSTCDPVDIFTEVSASDINANGINCSLINDSSLCNNIGMLATCCSWQNGTCKENKMTTACWDQMDAPPEGASFCEDYEAYTSYSLCTQIAGDPWYMPCAWNNDTERCGFKADKAFGNSSYSLVKIDNKKNCEAAGGKWILEYYCEGNRSVSTGRCEYKCNEETNCDKACFACERFDSSGNIVNSSNAESACEGSALGYCEFTADTSAPNGIGFCKAKEQFKKGIATDCDADCGACTYMGDPDSNNTTKRPSYFCQFSKANSVGGGCKWITDNTTIQGGYCINKGELVCEDACDRCTTEEDCIIKGESNKRNTTFENSTACQWDKTNDVCIRTGEDVEICWDGIDNDNDGSIDCMDSYCYSDTYCGFVEGDCFIWTDNNSCIANDCEWVVDNWGAWCDFKGASCWKNDWNVTACEENEYCEWHNDTYSGSSGWCEQDWSLEDACMNLNEADCIGAIGEGNNCVWTNDTYCNQYPNNETSWCLDFGGWCDYAPFAPKNCWLYDNNKTKCQDTSGCNWSVGGWSEPHCEVDWSLNCWNYYDQSACESVGCRWKSESWGGWCTHNESYCYEQSTKVGCEAVTEFNCTWDDWGGWCDSACFHASSSSSCSSYSGCVWIEESGWCSEIYTDQIDCWNSTNSNDETLCNAASGCRWKNPGWCDPIGFSGGAAMGAMGYGGGMGDNCWKYDGNKTECTNSSLINMSCGWMEAYEPHCEVDWSKDCWKYYDNTSCIDAECYWFNGTDDSGVGGETNNYCMNPGDICWKNVSLISNQTACNNNIYCNWSSWGTCDSACFSSSERTTVEEECKSDYGCRWITGWCSPAGTADMYADMEEGEHVQLGSDDCGTLDSMVDICGYGMKDMGDAYGFGISVSNFENSSVCNKERLISGEFGIGNRTSKFYYYLDMDGNSSGGCRLSHNSSREGFEFRFIYESTWNSTLDRAVETFTAFKCKDNNWEGTDIKLTAWKVKMCGEIGGSMIAVEKADLERFPTLYDSTKDIRVAVASANETTNITSPADFAGGGSTEGWTSPGAVDFEINDIFEYGANTAKFEEALRKCFVSFEDCYNGIDDDADGLVDCDDYDCKYSPKCSSTGVNAADFVDTSAPRLIGAKIEEYYDSALIIYDTTKPSNGTLYFYYNDSTCKNLNTTIYDAGILKNDSVREFRTTHLAHIYNDFGLHSLNYDLTNQTTYYYKLKICDEDGRCGQSKCSSFTTVSASRCSYCNFVTKIQTPNGWDVNYDLDQDGKYEHTQGKVCGPNAGMRTNYTAGRNANIKLNRTDGSVYIIFYNVTLTKTGLNSKTRNVTAGDSFKNGTTTDAKGRTVGYIGMVADTRDKIVYNLHPEKCVIKIPGQINELWHCPDDLNPDDCVNRTDEATLINTSNVSTGWREWEIPFCEFSTWTGGKPGSVSGAAAATAGGGGAGGGKSEEGVWNKTITLTASQFAVGETRELGIGERIKFPIREEWHHVGVRALTATTVTIEVKSEAQIATLLIGEEKKFEITGDDYYDVYVKLEGITENKANITVKGIYEKVPKEETETVAEKIKKKIEEIVKERSYIWIVIPISIIIVIAIVLWLVIRRKRR